MTKLITIKQTMDRLEIGRTQMWTLRQTGDFPLEIRIGASVRFREVEIERWITSRQAPPKRKRAR